MHDATRPVGIADAAYHLPGPALEVRRWAAEHNAEPHLAEELVAHGCSHFHASSDDSDEALIAACIDQILARRGGWLPQVRYLVHAHTQNFSAPPAPASLLNTLCARYGMQPTLSFSVGQVACSAVINALAWAARLLAADPDAEHALVVTSDRVFGGPRYRLRAPATIQSDGASAILLGRDDVQCLLGRCDLFYAPEMHEGPSTPANVTRIARLTWLHTKQMLQRHSEATGVVLADYAQILPVNADRYYWAQIARGLRLPESHFYLDNIARRGHACCADFAVNLVDHGFGLLGAGRDVLMCGQSNLGAHAALTLHPAPRAAAAQPMEQARCA
jgi:3-oxoacyl-[acyl-carrier-protein] synthase III